MCSATGRTGRVKINNAQSTTCRNQFLVHELQEIGAKALIFFGANAQEFAMGKTTLLWAVRKWKLHDREYFVLRVPHTSPTPFNTHGGRGANYITPIKELFRQAGININVG